MLKLVEGKKTKPKINVYFYFSDNIHHIFYNNPAIGVQKVKYMF